ncbi:aldehyde dehydrogenase family protein [Sphingomonas elodea]|uniref:aldehyde dehydrogenase family protein n=1 Tax=Sphingomonas elodea TaxID=179878 RepID=UPI002351CBB7|nr:aldehyde dehydrogenase family protein [Sphingomonas elodea]
MQAYAYPRIEQRPQPARQDFGQEIGIADDLHRAGDVARSRACRRKRTLGSLAPSGEPVYDQATRKIAPILLLDVDDGMTVMQEEIFGPILPLRSVADPAEATAYVNAHPRPLAAYYFGDDPERQQAFAAATTSGALVINDIMCHVSIDSLPFGGVGPSGMGAYHGIHGFRRFSHAKPVVVQSTDGASNLRLRTPYADKLAALRAILKA